MSAPTTTQEVLSWAAHNPWPATVCVVAVCALVGWLAWVARP